MADVPDNSTLTERLVTRLARLGERRSSRRSFVAGAALAGTALAVNPVGYLTRPQSAYASVCGPGASCNDGWSAFCCSINGGHNLCPPNTYAGGWWKADRSSFCGGAARYYIDCNANPGHHFDCHCNKSNCDHRSVACNIFRYGQCNTQVKGVTAVVCRQVSCLPPWRLYPGKCGHSSATDNNTAKHSAPCNTSASQHSMFFAPGPGVLAAGQSLRGGQRLVSNARSTQAVFGADGNFAVINQDGVVWQSGTHDVGPGARLTLYWDGRLHIYDRHGTMRWQNKRTRHLTHAALAMNSDGNLVVREATGEYVVAWQTRTHTP